MLSPGILATNYTLGELCVVNSQPQIKSPSGGLLPQPDISLCSLILDRYGISKWGGGGFCWYMTQNFNIIIFRVWLYEMVHYNWKNVNGKLEANLVNKPSKVVSLF